MDNLLNEEKTNEAPIENKKPQDKNIKRKRIISICLVLALIFSVVGTGVSYFSDNAAVSTGAEIGTVDVTVDMSGVNLKNENGYDILNPGDMRDVNFIVENTGNKSVDYNVIVKLTSSVPMSNNYYEISWDSEASAIEYDEFPHYEVYSSEYELYYPEDLQYFDGYGWGVISPKAPVGVRYMNDFGTEIVYVLKGGTLSGNSDLTEQENEYYKIVQEAFDNSDYAFLSADDNTIWLEYSDLEEITGIAGLGMGTIADPDALWQNEGKILTFPESDIVGYPYEYEGQEMSIDYILADDIHWYDYSKIAVSNTIKGLLYREWDGDIGDYVWSVLTAEEYTALTGVEVLYYDDYDAFFADEIIEYISDIEYAQLTDEEKAEWTVCPDSKEYNFKMLFDLLSDNKYQNSTVTISVEVKAKQHRNAEDGWDLIGNHTQIDKNNSIFEYGYDEQYRLMITNIKDNVDKSTLTDVSIPEGVEVIGMSVFESLPNLTTVTLPSTIKEIEYFAFCNCENLTSINFPEGLEVINVDAFAGCTSLQEVILPDSMVGVAKRAFLNCSGITTLDLGNGLKYIGEDAFQYCSGITEITIPASYVYNDGAVFAYSGIKKAIVAEGVQIIHPELFQYCEDMEEVVLPNTLTHIYDHAFYYCSSLTNVKLPDSIQHMGEYVFSNCHSIGTVKLPANLISWEKGVFAHSGITNVIFNNKINYISDECFIGCQLLESINIPENVEIICYQAFRDSGLKTFTIKEHFTKIEYWAFRFCEDLEEVYIESTRAMDRELFIQSGVKKVVFGKNCIGVPQGTFSSCTNLTDVTLNHGMVKIDKEAFKGCTSLTDITFPQTLMVIRYGAFQGCTGLTSIVFPKNIETIEDYAFFTCNNLTELTFYNLPSFGRWVFGTGSAYTKVNTIINVPSDITFSYSWSSDYRNFTYYYF